MEQYTDIIILFSGITIMFFIAIFTKKPAIFITFLLRGLLGAMIIYFANLGFQKAGIFVSVTLNSASLLTSAILGFPGLLLLYGIKIYKLLWEINKNKFFIKKLFTDGNYVSIMQLTSS